MAQDRKQLEALLVFIDRLASEPGNEWFVEQLRNKYGRLDNKVSKNKEIENIEKYLAIDYYLDKQDSIIDYSFIKDDITKQRLIADNREMLRYWYGVRAHKKDFDEFSHCAVLQIEMLLNIYYSNLSDNISDIISYIKKFNPKAKIDSAENIGSISLASKIWSFCNEHKVGYKTKQTIDYLREVRNEVSHRKSLKEKPFSVYDFKKLCEEQGFPLNNDGSINTFALEALNDPIKTNLFNNVIKLSPEYKRYCFLLWYEVQPYDMVVDAVKKIADIVKIFVNK